MAVDENGKVIGRPEDFTEFKWKYGDKFIEVFKDKEMVEDFIYLLDEYAEFSTIIFAIGDWFEKLFQFMLKYKYQPESQSVAYIKCMQHASNELRLWKDSADVIWYKITEDRFAWWYSFSREILLRKIMRPKCIELEEIIPKTNPFTFTMDEYADYNKINEFCKINANYNLPEIAEYIKDYFGR